MEEHEPDDTMQEGCAGAGAGAGAGGVNGQQQSPCIVSSTKKFTSPEFVAAAQSLLADTFVLPSVLRNTERPTMDETCPIYMAIIHAVTPTDKASKISVAENSHFSSLMIDKFKAVKGESDTTKFILKPCFPHTDFSETTGTIIIVQNVINLPQQRYSRQLTEALDGWCSYTAILEESVLYIRVLTPKEFYNNLCDRIDKNTKITTTTQCMHGSVQIFIREVFCRVWAPVLFADVPQ